MLKRQEGVGLSEEEGLEFTPGKPQQKASARSTGPSLSVVVLTRNRRQLLRGCLESLFAQDDAGKPSEILVVDDGSSDGTGDMVRQLAAARPTLAYHFQPHRGIAAARNRGIRCAAGEIVAIVADDYLLAPDYGRTILGFFGQHPEALVVRFKIVAAGDDFVSRVCHAYQEASVKRRLAEGWSSKGYLPGWRLLREEERVTTDHGLEAAGGAAFRREVFQRVGLFDESFGRAEDTDFTRRLRAEGIPVFYYPFHHIRHRYDRSLWGALKSAFLSGRYRWRYYLKYREGPLSIPSLMVLGLTMKLSALYWAFWRAHQTGSLRRLFLYLPFFLLLELWTKAGFLVDAVIRGRGGLAAPASPTE
jgi:GT2 family glycosyltransferase